jgi:tRNA (guanine-N(7)-)-methyltransferase subunit TRM82
MALPGNVLDVTFIHGILGELAAVVSVDNVHVPGSTRELRKDEVSSFCKTMSSIKLTQCLQSSARLQYLLHQEDGTWTDETPPADPFQWFSQSAGKDSKTSADGKALRDVLYGIENLRKRPGSED